MKRLLLLPLLVLFMLALAACNDRPKEVLSRSKMEDVLYDYHLMQGVIDQLPLEERMEKAQEYINAVYEKHGITEAQFDSSITYYNRHTKDLYKIYTNLKERYTAANEEIQLVNGNNDMMAIYATGGDTTNLWNSTRLIALRNKPLLNKESFTLLADTSFRQHDQFILTFTPIFIKEQDDARDLNLHVGLSIMYDNGKHIGTTRTILGNSTQQLTLQASDREPIKRITGFFYYKGKSTMRNICLINNISLVRMHEKEPKQPTVRPDSTNTDTIAKDTLPPPVEHRLTPEEIRQQNKSGHQIRIQATPSVRTPNSIGPRRRTTQPVRRRE